MAPKRFLTVREVADLLRMHPETIRDHVRRGKLQATYVGNKWLFESRYIEHEIKRRTRQDHGAVARMAAGMAF